MNTEHTEELFNIAPTFYSGRTDSITKNLMSFGFECGDGWFEPLRKMSVKMEVLNMMFRKYNVKIKAFQVKEKFGTLRVYTETLPIFPKFVNGISSVCLKISRLINKKANFKYDKHDDGTFEVKNHKFLFKIDYAIIQFVDFIQNLFLSKNYRTIATFLTDEAEKIINEIERECFNYCEECGRQIGDEYSPRCETTGWITYICENCAKKFTSIYIKDGKEYLQGKPVKKNSKKTEIGKTRKPRRKINKKADKKSEKTV